MVKNLKNKSLVLILEDDMKEKKKQPMNQILSLAFNVIDLITLNIPEISATCNTKKLI